MESEPVFRASKKRKFARRTESADKKDSELDSPDYQAEERQEADDTTTKINISEILRLRKPNRLRGGVQFVHAGNARTDFDMEDLTALTTTTDQDDLAMQDISSRFTGSTGQVVDIDRHMMAYIDSEIAKRREPTNPTGVSRSQNQPSAPSEDDYTDEEDGDNAVNMPTSKPSAAAFQPQNPLSEFDLGPSAHDTNLARTNAAIARAQTGLPPLPDEPQRKPRRPRKPRLGRDGKPFRPRPRKRRDSSDLARDQLVEQVLQEHRLEGVYQTPTTSSVTTKPTGSSKTDAAQTVDNEDADERIAEQFRQEFMDAMAERHSRNQAQAKAKATKGAEPAAQGPKLGGSRSARAKMQAMQQQQGVEKK